MENEKKWKKAWTRTAVPFSLKMGKWWTTSDGEGGGGGGCYQVM